MKWLVWLLPLAACAQPIGIGVKIGAPVTDSFNIATGRATFLSDSTRFVIGPTVELRLPFGFGIEVDALYRRYAYDYTSGITNPLTGELLSARTRSGVWEFPVLAKYRTPFPLVKPYVVGGLNFNRLSGVKQTLTCLGGSCTNPFNDVSHRNNVGITFGAGLQVNALLIKISPEIRYTRWTVNNFDVTGGFGSSLKFNKNQADFLVGISF
jgi:opacity protein-like surface antigen